MKGGRSGNVATAWGTSGHANRVGRPSADGKPPTISFERRDFAARTAGTTASPVAIRAAITAARAHPVPCGSPRRAPIGGRRVGRPSEKTMSVPRRPLHGKWPPLRTTEAPVSPESSPRGLGGVGEGGDSPIQQLLGLGEIGGEDRGAPEQLPIRGQRGRGEERRPGGGTEHGVEDEGKIAVRRDEGEDRLGGGAGPHHPDLDGPEEETLRDGGERFIQDVARDGREAGEGGGGLHREARDDRAGVNPGRRRRARIHQYARAPGRSNPPNARITASRSFFAWRVTVPPSSGPSAPARAPRSSSEAYSGGSRGSPPRGSGSPPSPRERPSRGGAPPAGRRVREGGSRSRAPARAAGETPGSAPRPAAPSARKRSRARLPPWPARAPRRRAGAVFPGERTARRWTKFSSSRTFPFHGRAARSSIASFEKERGGRERTAQYFCRKWSASSGMSSFLSASEGTRSGKTFSRSKRSSRNFPSATIFRRSRLVAAMIPPRNALGRLEPTGAYSRSWSTRSSLACRSRGVSPISSRKRVPSVAAASFPSRALSAR